MADEFIEMTLMEVTVLVPEDKVAALYRAVASVLDGRPRRPQITPEGRERMREVGRALAQRRQVAS